MANVIRKAESTIVQKYPVLGSSVDPNKVALSVKGTLIASAGLIVTLSGLFGVSIEAGDIQSIADSVQNIVATGMVLWGLLTGVWGVVRKIINQNR